MQWIDNFQAEITAEAAGKIRIPAEQAAHLW